MSRSEPQPLSQGAIFRFWAPLAATWLMMSAEGPFVAALIARLPGAKENLAAFGVAFVVALVVEAPIMMIMSAATALVRGRASFLALRRFIYTLNAIVTAAMVVLLLPPVFRLLAEGLIGLPAEVARLAYIATVAMLPWPAAIGYRRFYQGVLTRHGLTRLVAFGTVVRLATMVAAGTLLYALGEVPGAVVGGAALAAGVTVEAVASRVMARRVVRRLLHALPAVAEADLPTGQILAFYVPLALTTTIALGVHPLVTFAIGNSRAALESLAVLPVVNSFTFVFRSTGLAFQEVAIALLGDAGEGHRPLRRFTATLATATSLGLALVAFTPLASVWFRHVAGLTPELESFVAVPVRLLVLMPALEVLLAWQRSLLVHARRTVVISWGTVVEVTGIVAVLALAVGPLDAVGVTAAAAAILAGRLAANGFLAGALARRWR